MIGPKPPKLTATELRRMEETARAIVTERDGGVCVRCRRVHPIHGINWDHRLSRSIGGLWLPSHGQLLCGSGTTGCHGWRTSNPADAIREGYAVLRSATLTPAQWPARRWFATPYGTVRLGWALYDDEGGVEEIDEIEAQRRLWEGGAIDAA